ncbi:MAG: HD domain-containing protein [Chloroflexota bacterium]|nr:MAG: HD domain-containing protein [Chloroflexota bacterium]
MIDLSLSTFKPSMQIDDPLLMKDMIIARLEELIPSSEIKVSMDEIKYALDFAYERHKGQTRREGAPYVMHPYRVLLRLLEEGLHTQDTMIIAILHDVVEDTNTAPEEVSTVFGTIVGDGVLALSRQIYTEDKKIPDEDYFNGLYRSVDYVKRIKVYDRIDNTFSQLSIPVKSKEEMKHIVSRYVSDTNAIYAQLTDIDHRLEEKLQEASAYILSYNE